MSGTGDLRAVLTDERHYVTPFKPADRILAALHAADEPLVSEVECLTPCQKCGPTTDCTGTVRIVAMTEDVLRERLDGWVCEDTVDTVVRALFGEAS